MKKKVNKIIKLQVSAGKATPAPPIGPILGQNGVNIPEFCKQFNDRTKDMELGMPLPVILTLFADRSFVFEIKTPPTSFLLMKAAGMTMGSKIAGRETLAYVTLAQVEEIAKKKIEDMGLDLNSISSAVNSVKGTARSMGIAVTEEAAEETSRESIH